MDIPKLKNIPKKKSKDTITKLLDLVDELLPRFTISEEFIKILTKKKNEPQHTIALCVYLRNNSKYCFINEQSQRGSSSVDIGVYKGSNLFFTFEAKLLPTPKGKNRTESEYVYSKPGTNGAGIQRFKELKHGLKNDDSPLEQNGIIAYVKNQDFEYWLSKINSWIQEINWTESEKLKKDYFNSIARLKSLHKRIDGSDLILHHFWIKVS